MTQTAYDIAVLADTPDLFWKLDDASGNPVDSSGNGRNATSTISVTYQQPGPFSGSSSVGLPGGGTVVRSSVPTAVQDNWTLELWFKLGLITNDQQALVYNGNAGANGYGALVRSGGSQFLQYLAGGVSFGGNTAASLSGGWQHLVLVRTASEWRFWFNGVQDSTGGITTPNVPSGNFGIGANSLQGNWSNVASYSTALSGARIVAHYNAGISAPSTDIMLAQGRSGTGGSVYRIR